MQPRRASNSEHHGTRPGRGAGERPAPRNLGLTDGPETACAQLNATHWSQDDDEDALGARKVTERGRWGQKTYDAIKTMSSRADTSLPTRTMADPPPNFPPYRHFHPSRAFCPSSALAYGADGGLRLEEGARHADILHSAAMYPNNQNDFEDIVFDDRPASNFELASCYPQVLCVPTVFVF